jgi:hypothetical protein
MTEKRYPYTPPSDVIAQMEAFRAGRQDWPTTHAWLVAHNRFPYTEPSDVTEQIHAYRDGRQDWPTTRDWLVAHKYPTPERMIGKPMGPEIFNWDAPDHTAGSWDDVQRAYDYKWLTREEYYEVSNLLWEMRRPNRRYPTTTQEEETHGSEARP